MLLEDIKKNSRMFSNQLDSICKVYHAIQTWLDASEDQYWPTDKEKFKQEIEGKLDGELDNFGGSCDQKLLKDLYAHDKIDALNDASLNLFTFLDRSDEELIKFRNITLDLITAARRHTEKFECMTVIIDRLKKGKEVGLTKTEVMHIVDHAYNSTK